MSKSVVLPWAMMAAVLLQFASACAADPPGRKARDPIESGLTVLTYNTHLFKDSSAVVGAFFKGKKIVFDDDDRAKHIAKRVRESGADIVGLQEVWAYKRQDWFKNELKSVYPYAYRASGTDGRFDLDPKVDIHRELLKTSSGLLLLSKYRLKNLDFHPFPSERSSKQEDQWATKGVITATVEPWPGGPTIRIGITHACTDGGHGLTGKEKFDPAHPEHPDLPDLKDLALWTTGDPAFDCPAIMMGDFNIPRSSEKYGPAEVEYGKAKAIFRSVNAFDAYRRLHNVNDPTVNGRENRMRLIFGSGGDPKCLDYVFVKPCGGGLKLTPISAKVLQDWKYKLDWTDILKREDWLKRVFKPQKKEPPMDLSDHYPIVVTFKVTKSPVHPDR